MCGDSIRCLRRLAAALAASALAAGIAAAGDGDGLPPPAVGRITLVDTPVGGLCTGTLVAADLVLTAAHCLSPGRLGRALPAEAFQFAAGRSGGRELALRRGKAISFPQGGQGRVATQRDLALLELEAPVPAELAAPLPVASPVAADFPFAFAGYGRDAPETVAVDADCWPRMVHEGMLGLSCEVAAGNSGAPVLGRIGGAWHVVAVMSATNTREGPVRALAAILPADVVARVRERR